MTLSVLVEASLPSPPASIAAAAGIETATRVKAPIPPYGPESDGMLKQVIRR